MARRVSRRSHQQEMMQTWWVRGLLALVFLLISYGFASLAIDSANWLEYLAAALTLWYGVKNSIRTFRLALFS
jgi:type VI protein secretion system component VasF